MAVIFGGNAIWQKLFGRSEVLGQQNRFELAPGLLNLFFSPLCLCVSPGEFVFRQIIGAPHAASHTNPRTAFQAAFSCVRQLPYLLSRLGCWCQCRLCVVQQVHQSQQQPTPPVDLSPRVYLSFMIAPLTLRYPRVFVFNKVKRSPPGCVLKGYYSVSWGRVEIEDLLIVREGSRIASNKSVFLQQS